MPTRSGPAWPVSVPGSMRGLKALAYGDHPDSILGYVMQVHFSGPVEDDGQDFTVVDHVKLIRNLPVLRFEGANSRTNHPCHPPPCRRTHFGPTCAAASSPRPVACPAVERCRGGRMGTLRRSGPKARTASPGGRPSFVGERLDALELLSRRRTVADARDTIHSKRTNRDGHALLLGPGGRQHHPGTG